MTRASDPHPAATDRRRLRWTQALLVILGLSLALVGRRTYGWPIVTWPVYGRVRPMIVGPTHIGLELRVTTESSRVVTLLSHDLVEQSRHLIADQAIAKWDADGANRRYLAKLAERATGERLDHLEIWEVVWSVDINAVPPFDRDHPLSEKKLGSFSANFEKIR